MRLLRRWSAWAKAADIFNSSTEVVCPVMRWARKSYRTWSRDERCFPLLCCRSPSACPVQQRDLQPPRERLHPAGLDRSFLIPNVTRPRIRFRRQRGTAKVVVRRKSSAWGLRTERAMCMARRPVVAPLRGSGPPAWRASVGRMSAPRGCPAPAHSPRLTKRRQRTASWPVTYAGGVMWAPARSDVIHSLPRRFRLVAPVGIVQSFCRIGGHLANVG